MTLPHQCRCVICGEIGTIVPGLPNVFAQPPTLQPPSEPPSEQPEHILASQSFREAVNALDQPQPTVQRTDLCAHGYTVCRPCKHPHADPNTQAPNEAR